MSVGRAECGEQLGCALRRALGRRFKPVKLRRVALAKVVQLKPSPGQVDAADLGLDGGGVRALFHDGPQPQVQSRPKAPGPTRALAHALHGDVCQLQAVQANARIEGRNAR